MKRRDFLTKSTVGVATAGTLITTLGTENTNAASQIEKKNTSDMATQAISGGPAVADSMTSASKARSGITIGGIGAGGAEIRKDGVFYNWSIANNSPKGTGDFLFGVDYDRKASKTQYGSLYPFQEDYVLFFILRYQLEGENPKMKVLQIEDGYKVTGVDMHIYEFPWLTGVEQIDYSGCFPMVKLAYKDAEMPFEVEMNTWSPFVPHDIKNSSLPILNFDFKIKSKTSKKASVMISAVYRSMVGYDIPQKVWESEVIKTDKYVGQISSIVEVDTAASAWGQMGIVAHHSDASFHAGWGHRHQYHEWVLMNNILKNIDQTPDGRNYTDKKTGKKIGRPENYNAVAVSKDLASGQAFDANFSLVWNFPNQYDTDIKNIVGHYYSNFFASAKEVMNYASANRADLLKKTQNFVSSYYDSTAPQFLLDLVNSQLTTFITSSVLGKKMEYGVLEGITKHQNWGPVGTTDVNMYGGVMVASLFPDLAKSTMKIHRQLQLPTGEIRHSFKKGFAEALIGVAGVTERLDLHSQYTVMALRDFFLTNDKAYLTEMWPSVKKALEYTLNERDLNGDKQPDMTGIMSSYDNFPMYGMASYIQSQWLAALASALSAAKVMNDTAFISKYTPIFEQGKKLAEQKLWNGNYYRLYNSDLKEMKSKDGAGKEIMKNMEGVDEGCLTDQLIGQWAAHWSGLGDLFEPAKRKQALKSVVKMSYKSDFGLKNCSWPGFDFYKPVPEDIWVDQGNTVWSGVEVSFVSFLMYEGLYEEALAVAKTVHERYLKCGRYWDHQEFGGHYFRAMGAWGILNGMLGLSINQEAYTFAPKSPSADFKYFFSFPGGYGNVEASKGKLTVSVLQGEWKCKELKVKGVAFAGATVKANVAGKTIVSSSIKDAQVTLAFKGGLSLKEGQKLELV